MDAASERGKGLKVADMLCAVGCMLDAACERGKGLKVADMFCAVGCMLEAARAVEVTGWSRGWTATRLDSKVLLVHFTH